jgi:hypothetical protein
MPAAETPEPVTRLWKTAGHLPQTVRLLGTRYRALFLAHAQACSPRGELPAVADALAFADFLRRQERVGLLANEREAVSRDERALKRRFRLRRDGQSVEAVEKWILFQWVGL